MGAIEGFIVDGEDFFAPVSADLITGLMGEYQRQKRAIEDMAAAMRAEGTDRALGYFIAGNVDEQRYTLPGTIDRLFNVGPAVSHLDAEFWNRALNMTDVLSVMPEARRQEWFEMIRNPCGVKATNGYGRDANGWKVEPIPAFEEESVRATLEELLAKRAMYFAERIDGIFRALSRTHVTNRPEGFGVRMIIPGVIDDWGSAKTGHINDLRAVVAKFMGRDDPHWSASSELVKECARSRPGQWVAVDGGALRIRVYPGVGTAHVGVHPDMAWRLNAMLAKLYPAAIPESSRTRPKAAKRAKAVPLIDRPLPFAVLRVLAGRRKLDSMISLQFVADASDQAYAEAGDVLRSIGGIGDGRSFQFDYDPTEVISEIVCSGVIPDHVSHQFYPTPEGLAQAAVAIAKEGAHDGARWLEPSAGTGNLASLMPEPHCVEVSHLRCEILRAKGLQVTPGDFLSFPAKPEWDRIVMNPPFSKGRWQAHLEHAAAHLAPGGRLVAILPASAAGKALPGLKCSWSAPYHGEFAGASVSVVIATMDKS